MFGVVAKYWALLKPQDQTMNLDLPHCNNFIVSCNWFSVSIESWLYRRLDIRDTIMTPWLHHVSRLTSQCDLMTHFAIDSMIDKKHALKAAICERLSVENVQFWLCRGSFDARLHDTKAQDISHICVLWVHAIPAEWGDRVGGLWHPGSDFHSLPTTPYHSW